MSTTDDCFDCCSLDSEAIEETEEDDAEAAAAALREALLFLDEAFLAIVLPVLSLSVFYV